jgi:pyruvate/2-oxoglutarate dehydrogenase complex dihydrolipoamide dehydrogenase (E3) component
MTAEDSMPRKIRNSKGVYDALIIGAGQAGPPLAIELAQKKWAVALVERKDLGGSCVNFGCTPTKAVIASARVAHLARRGREFGIRIPTVEPDLAAVLDRARGVVMQSRARLREALTNQTNLALIAGHARFAGREGRFFRVSVGERVLLAKEVVLDTGTRSRIPAIPGLSRVDFLTAENWIDRPTLPSHLVVLGGGYTGLEMAQFYRRMGSRVTVIEKSREIAAGEDEEVGRALRRILESEEIAFRLETRVESVEASGSSVRVSLRTSKRKDVVISSHVLIATGRQPNTDDLGLETIGLKTARDGTLDVTNRLATEVRGIWAAGDIRGGPMFTHTAWDDFRVLASQLAGDRSRTTRRIVPYAIYTDPQLGRVGMSAADARQSGRNVRVGRFELRNNGKAKELGETEGFIQVVADARSDRILGATVLAAEGAELVHLFVDVMKAGGRSASIRDAVHVHPTLAEAVQSAVQALS